MVCYGDVDASGKDALGNEFMIPSEKVFILFYFYHKLMIHEEKEVRNAQEKVETSSLCFLQNKLQNQFERARNLLEMRETILSCIIMDAYTVQNIFVKNF